MRIGIFLGLLLVCVDASWAGSVSYPAVGNVDLREGTIEIWITPQAVLYPDLPKDRYQGILSLFNMNVPDNFGFGALFYARGDTSALHVSMGHHEIKRVLLPIPGTAVDWRDTQNQLHHIAMTWKGRDMRLFADGIQIGSRMQAAPFSGKLAGVTLTIGSAKGRDTPFILHAVRTSNIARTAEGLLAAQPVIDLHTLLLDRFDETDLAGDGKQLPAELISGFTSESSGTLSGNWSMVSSPNPGIAFYKIKSQNNDEEE